LLGPFFFPCPAEKLGRKAQRRPNFSAGGFTGRGRGAIFARPGTMPGRKGEARMEETGKDDTTNRGGRKPRHDYSDPMLLLRVEGWARDGLEDRQVAARLGLSAGHFCGLKKQWPGLSEALDKGRRPLDTLVESSLFRRATGMRVRTVVRESRDGGASEVVRETETELPPDVGAAMAWLRHRKPEKWNTATRTQVELEASGSIAIEKWLETVDN